ncbi:MAG TPA: carboxylesterase family protein [Acidimicrobiales bacterium]|nr:carboxylesterase family protein [Acidimicrobiales bacterium]
MGTVTLPAGRLAGREDGPLSVFLGVPFARGPRWRAPEPAAPWAGTRDATAFGPAAPQGPGFTTVLPLEDVAEWDEDGCLTLNVWAPSGASDLPVMVWFHGGSFMTGSSAMPLYNGARLAAEQRMVVVSANYRLGALGYAPVAGRTNVGVLDQLAALEWVRDHIAEFGGDPRQVTIFGESAGAGSVLHIVASPLARGLVRRAIAQSGATNFTPTADQMADVADRIRRRVDVDGPVAAIIEAQAAVLAELIPTRGVLPYHPTVDGDVVPARPQAGLPADVDLLIGTTRDEMTLYVDDWELSDDKWRARAARALENLPLIDPGRVIDAYADEPSPARRWGAFRTDADMWLPCLDVAEAHPGTTFLYRFDWGAAAPNERLGACHAIDLPFTFDTFDVGTWGAFVGAGPEAATVGAALRGAWAAFARGEEPWAAFEGTRRATMVFDGPRHAEDGEDGAGAGCRTEHDPRGAVRAAWRAALGPPRASAAEDVTVG